VGAFVESAHPTAMHGSKTASSDVMKHCGQSREGPSLVCNRTGGAGPTLIKDRKEKEKERMCIDTDKGGLS
jgi:hypothetical protein